MGLIQECELYFSTKNLYDVLGVRKGASLLDIKKAYRKASLLIHPDRVEDEAKVEATRKFQVLAKVHFILSDIEKRAVYDESGEIDEENNISENDSTPEFWENYWRNLFPKITKEDIDTFFSKYKGSDEEIQDLKECYVKYEGDMNLIAEVFLGYDVEEEDRLITILTELINKDEIPSFPKFVKESKTKKMARIKRFKSEAKEAAEVKEEMDCGLMKAMSRRTQEREGQFNSMIQSLEAKYGKQEVKGKRKKR
ncbi:dnaJ homolog subfamily C member 9 [Parasteatoda tepidariorum]|uniref:DnaJ-like protein subfamily C member 9 n=1 Tax=Parasteatoda tepidariorum TaxID=114398 RepID=A0A2L2Y6P9_PARTP|nr:dnaJ homolog subfamily C member 9 [Parasteatoda tepidariorum]